MCHCQYFLLHIHQHLFPGKNQHWENLTRHLASAGNLPPSWHLSTAMHSTGAASGWEEIPHIQSQEQRNPSKTVGGANSHLESNPITTSDAQRTQNKPVCTRTQGLHRDWERTVFEHLLWKYGSAVLCRRDRGSGCGYGISPLGGGHH